MIDRNFAESFAREWIAAWNVHDLDRVFTYYDDDFRMESPYIRERMGIESGRLIGKQAVRPYWQQAMESEPPLHFVLQQVYVGVNTVVLRYLSLGRREVCETFTFSSSRLIISGVSQHGPALESA